MQQFSYSSIRFNNSKLFLSEVTCFPIETEIDGTKILSNAAHNTLILKQIEKPFSIFRFIKWKHKKNKKLIAAVLAFPFPFGIVGLHRIYLGTAPYVPIVYIGSLGGVFGILPLMDFIAILFEKDMSSYIDNTKVFMWVK